MGSVSDPVSGFARALAALGEAGVDFIVVGVGGISFYARTPADAFATLDGDRVVIHNSYCRLVMRPDIDYSAHADELICTRGEAMSQLLGREDVMFLDHQDNDPERFARTVIGATS